MDKVVIDRKHIAVGERMIIDFVAKDEFVTAYSIVEILDNVIHLLGEFDIQQKKDQTLIWRMFDMSAKKNGNSQQQVRLDLLSTPKAEHYSVGIADNYLQCWSDFNSEAVFPNNFPEVGLDRARNMGKVLENGVAELTFSKPGEAPVYATAQSISNINEVYRKTSYVYSYGSIEGRLLLLSALTRQPSCKVVDEVTRTPVTCYFSDPDLEQQANNAYRDRVSVFGRIKYNRTGKPVSMNVSEFTLLRRESELPQIEQLFGINITGGKDAVDHIRGLRDDK